MGEKKRGDCKGGEDCYNNDHLCKIAGRKDFELVRVLVRDAAYFCRKCGRAANRDARLCKPVKI